MKRRLCFRVSCDHVFRVYLNNIRNAGVAALGFPDNPGRPDVSPITVNIVGVVYTMQGTQNRNLNFNRS
jgi:hypothetical protein